MEETEQPAGGRDEDSVTALRVANAEGLGQRRAVAVADATMFTGWLSGPSGVCWDLTGLAGIKLLLEIFLGFSCGFLQMSLV